RETGRAARFDTDDPAAADMPEVVRKTGARSFVASPIVVEGKLWGAIMVASRRSLPQETAARLADFTELVATAVANTQAREQLRSLADEQAALRRVATRVAQGAPPAEVFAAVSAEGVRLLVLAPERADFAAVVRFDPAPVHVIVGVSRALEAVPLGSRWRAADLYAETRVLRTGRSA